MLDKRKYFQLLKRKISEQLLSWWKKSRGNILLICLIISTNTSDVMCSEREEELSGEHETVQNPLPEPEIKEPQRQEAGSNQPRPTLKLPEVVVKGDNQYHITAERRELTAFDPMMDMKEIPDDLLKVKISVLDENKNEPTADTVTAKNYLFSLETGAGNAKLGEIRLMAGYEMEYANFVFRGDFNAGEQPMVYGINPYDQQGTIDLDVGITLIPGSRLVATIARKKASFNQPSKHDSGWGDWLEQSSTEISLLSEFELLSDVKFKLSGSFDNFDEKGIRQPTQLVLNDKIICVKAEVEKSVDVFRERDLVCSFNYYIQQQQPTLDSITMNWDEKEIYRALQAGLRYKPTNIFQIEAGVKIDDFQGVKSDALSKIIGQISLNLPAGITLYGGYDAGLNCPTIPQWASQQPRQDVGWLPEPERILSYYHLGWRQNINEGFFTQLSWFKKDQEHVLFWLDTNADGLFTLLNSSLINQDGIVVEVEIHYSKIVYQSFHYNYLNSQSPLDFKLPYQPDHEASTELNLDLNEWNIMISYHYYSKRYIDIFPNAEQLGEIHLVNAKCEWKLNDLFYIYLKAENLLNIKYELWRGYHKRGISGIIGCGFRF